MLSLLPFFVFVSKILFFRFFRFRVMDFSKIVTITMCLVILCFAWIAWICNFSTDVVKVRQLVFILYLLFKIKNKKN